MGNLLSYTYIALTILLTVYGQITIKWQVIGAGNYPLHAVERIAFIMGLLYNPWIVSALLAAFFAALSWMVAMTKFEISHAYPFTSLSFVIVMICSSVFFNEGISLLKVVGLSFVVVGIIIGSQG